MARVNGKRVVICEVTGAEPLCPNERGKEGTLQIFQQLVHLIR